MKSRIFTITFTILFCCTVFFQSANAALNLPDLNSASADKIQLKSTVNKGIEYLEPATDDQNNVVFDENGEVKFIKKIVPSENVIHVTSDMGRVTWGENINSTTWYVVDSNVTINGRINVVGNVNLILCDGCVLKAHRGIEVSSNNHYNAKNEYYFYENITSLKKITDDISNEKNRLTIYGQTSGTGKLFIDSEKMVVNAENAGIGSGYYGANGPITINGGIISVKGGKYGAAIGSGDEGVAKYITINGGKVTAKTCGNGAAIGGGDNSAAWDIVINGGVVNAISESCGAEERCASAIGAGNYGNAYGIKINGGNITVGYDSRYSNAIGAYPGFVEKYIEIGENASVVYCDEKGNHKETESSEEYEAEDDSYDFEEYEAEDDSYDFEEYEAEDDSYDFEEYETEDDSNDFEEYETEDDSYSFEEYETEEFYFGGYSDNNKKVQHINADKIPETETIVYMAPVMSNGQVTIDEKTNSAKMSYKTAEAVILDKLDLSDLEGKVFLGEKNKITWYAVKGDVRFDVRFVVSGNVNLILCDGCKLHIPLGISVNENLVEKNNGVNNSLTIYGQNKGTGCLLIDGTAHEMAGIGSASVSHFGEEFEYEDFEINEGSDTDTVDCGIITINGGTINVTGGDNAAGIGGGYMGNGNNITINGGTIAAKGGDCGYYEEGGCGIGGGYGGEANNIVINGGTVEATGTGLCSGIGSSDYLDDMALIVSSYCRNISINGGIVTAIGGKNRFKDQSGIGSYIQSLYFYGYALAGDTEENANTINIRTEGAYVLSRERFVTNSKLAVFKEDENFKLYGKSKPSGGIKLGQVELINFKSKPDNNVTFKVYKSASADKESEGFEIRAEKLEENIYELYLYATKPLEGGIYYIRTFIAEGTENEERARNSIKITIFEKQVSYMNPVINQAEYVIDRRTGKVCKNEAFEDAIPMSENTIILGNYNTTSWYVVNRDITIEKRIIVNGDVNLILCDGCTLKAAKGISVNSSNTTSETNCLTIFGQKAGTGKLLIDDEQNRVDTNNAGIGSEFGKYSGRITINGGIITVTGGEYAAGIGGGCEGTGTYITINDGVITAKGGIDAAGIGGGECANGIEIIINGGKITALGGLGGAGIGGGASVMTSFTYGGIGQDIIINGGKINAVGGYFGAGIGGGCEGKAENIYICGGQIKASSVGEHLLTSEEDCHTTADAIGGCYSYSENVTIINCDITAASYYNDFYESYENKDRTFDPAAFKDRIRYNEDDIEEMITIRLKGRLITNTVNYEALTKDMYRIFNEMLNGDYGEKLKKFLFGRIISMTDEERIFKKMLGLLT